MRQPAAHWILAAVALSVLFGIAAAFLYTSESGPESDSPEASADALRIRPAHTLYRPGETVRAEGTIEGATEGGTVEISIVDSNGDLWASGEAEPKEAAGGLTSFSAAFHPVRESDPSGIYRFQARYGAAQGNASFLVSTPTGVTVEIRSLRFQNLGGGEALEGRAGDVILVTGSVANLGDAAGDLTFVVEVRDERNGLDESGFVSTAIPAGGEKTLTIGWPAREEGAFTVYAYVQEDVESRRIVSNIATRSLQIRG